MTLPLSYINLNKLLFKGRGGRAFGLPSYRVGKATLRQPEGLSLHNFGGVGAKYKINTLGYNKRKHYWGQFQVQMNNLLLFDRKFRAYHKQIRD